MIRTILIALTLFLYLVLLLPVLGIEWIYHKINPEKADYQQLRMVQAAFRLMLKMTGARIQVIGEENVPIDRAVLYVGNHKSYFDILLTYSRVPRLTGYVAKKEMESFPILSIWMKRLHCLFLDRKDIKQGLKTILTGIDLIKNGISVCIFPEGTRNKSNDRLLPFKEGSLKMAEKTGCPIIPFASTILRSCSKVTCPLSVPVTSSSSTANPSIRQNFRRKKRNSSVLTAANRLRTC